MKKGAKQKQGVNAVTAMFTSLLGGKTVEEFAESHKPPSAREVAQELRNILKEEAEAEESGINYDRLGSIEAAKLKASSSEEE